MAENNIDVSPSYTISLDSIDMTYLGKYFRSPRAETIPLWTNQKLDGESDYCKVLLVTKANKNEDCYSEPSETYTCHICNVNVPRICQEKHNASDQHDTMKKIYEKVLESVTKQINTNKIHNDENFGDDVYYCAQCSKIIKLINRQKHETSDYHAKSVNELNIANHFYKILRERKNNDESEVNEPVPSDVNDAKLSEGHETVFCEVNEARSDEGVETLFSEVNEARSDEGVETLFSEVNEARFSELNETVFSEVEDDKLSEITVSAFSEVNEAECSEVDDLETDQAKENDDGNNEENNEEMESSFSSLDSDDDSLEQPNNPTEQPQENMETTTQPTNEQENNSFEEYVKEMINKYNLKIKLPVITGDFIWMVAPNGTVAQISRDHFHSYRPLMNNVYCQLCNLWITQDTRDHDIYDRHVKKIFRPINNQFTRWVDKMCVTKHCVLCNEMVLKDSQNHLNNDIHQNITKKILCEDCNIYIDTHKFTVHIKSKKHLDVLMKHNSIIDINSKDTYCNICKHTVPRYALKFHINSKHHIKKKMNDSSVLSNLSTNTNSALSSPAISVRVLNCEYCEVCKVKVPHGAMQTHVNGKSHKKVLSNSENKKSKENKARIGALGASIQHTDGVPTTIRLYDNVAGASPSVPSCSNASDRVNNETQAYDEFIEFIDQARTRVRCKICDVNIFFTEKSIADHMAGRTHKANKQKMEAYNKLLVSEDGDNTNVKCQICCESIEYVDKNIIEHMNGRTHLDAETELFDFHLITKESTEFLCECCGIQTTDYLDHINSKTHTILLLQKYEIDRAQMRKYVYEDNDNNPEGHRHRELYRNLIKYNCIYKTEDGNFYCAMCLLKLSRVSEIDHVLGERHGSRIANVNKLSSILEQLSLANIITS